MSHSQSLQKNDPNAIIEQVIAQGDLSKLTAEQRVSYYNALCQSLGLNPLTKPFEYLQLDKKLVLYARKDATEQLRSNKQISIIGLDTEQVGDLLIVTAHARTPDGRTDSDRGVVYLKGLFGDNLSNAHMKAVTKAKRRVTLSICGLGFLDESEIESIRDAQRISVDNSGLILSQRNSGLDQWKCDRGTAMAVLDICQKLKVAGASDEQIKAKLPAGVTTRKELTEEQAIQLVRELTGLYEALKPEPETHQGEVVSD